MTTVFFPLQVIPMTCLFFFRYLAPPQNCAALGTHEFHDTNGWGNQLRLLQKLIQNYSWVDL